MKILERKLNINGKLILSIPNIAHNSIIISLLKDKFEYTTLGLLDSTHKYFVTHESAIEMVKNAGFKIHSINSITKSVGNNEVKSLYSDVSDCLRWELKNRKYGEVYQTLIIAGKYEMPYDDISESISSESLDEYHCAVLPNGTMENVMYFFSQNGNIAFDINIENLAEVLSLRIIPMETECVIKNPNMFYYEDNEKKIINSNWNNGIKTNSYIIMSGDDKEINYLIPEGVKRVYFTAEAKPIFQQDKQWARQLSEEYIKILEKNDEQLRQYENLQKKFQEQLVVNENIRKELEEAIKLATSFNYRMKKRIKKIIKRIK